MKSFIKKAVKFCENNKKHEFYFELNGIQVKCFSNLEQSKTRLLGYVDLNEKLEGEGLPLVSIMHIHSDEFYYEVNDLLSNLEAISIRKVNNFVDVWHTELIFSGPDLSLEEKTILYIPEPSKNYFALRSENLIFLITPISLIEPEKFFFHIFREVIYREAENRSGLIFHAACLNYMDEGFLLLGTSGSGKTTLLSCLLENTDSKFISNDRTVIFVENYKCAAIPLPIRYGLKTEKERLIM